MTLSQHLRIYESLTRNKVKYLVIGGIAAISYGVPRNTLDLDLWIEPIMQNSSRLLTALKKVGFGTAYLISPDEILKNEITIFNDYLKLDVLTAVKGLKGFNLIWKRRVVRKIDDVRINFLSLPDLIRSKSKSKQSVDREDIKALRQILRKKKED